MIEHQIEAIHGRGCLVLPVLQERIRIDSQQLAQPAIRYVLEISVQQFTVTMNVGMAVEQSTQQLRSGAGLAKYQELSRVIIHMRFITIR